MVKKSSNIKSVSIIVMGRNDNFKEIIERKLQHRPCKCGKHREHLFARYRGKWYEVKFSKKGSHILYEYTIYPWGK